MGVSPVLFYDPVERVAATLHPNRTYEKVVFDPWHQESWDVNDTVSLTPKNDVDIRGFFVQDDGTLRLPADLYTPTWYALRADPEFEEEASRRWPDSSMLNAERVAAEKTRVHENTHTTTYLDTLGRAFLTVAHNKWMDEDSDVIPETHEEKYLTRINLDIEGNQREVIDAKERIVMRYEYDMLGNRIKQESMDAGTRWMLNDVAGQPIRAWDSRMFKRRFTYDKLRRPTKLFVSYPGIDDEPLLVEETRYGESKPDGEATNHRQKVWQVRDGAGIPTNESYDFKGNLLRSTRRLLLVYRSLVDWDLDPQPEDETFSTHTRYDALDRPVQSVPPHSDREGTKFNVVQRVYNEAGLIERVDAWLELVEEPTKLLDPGTATQHSIRNVDYNAKGQRLRIDYDNNVSTFYVYDRQTFHLVRMFTVRYPEEYRLPDVLFLRLVHPFTVDGAVTFPDDCPHPPITGWPGCHVQNLYYTYDPMGNISHIRDDAQQRIYFKNQYVDPSTEYTYDATYRLIEALGREHLGQINGEGAPIPHSHNDTQRIGRMHASSG